MRAKWTGILAVALLVAVLSSLTRCGSEASVSEADVRAIVTDIQSKESIAGARCFWSRYV